MPRMSHPRRVCCWPTLWSPPMCMTPSRNWQHPWCCGSFDRRPNPTHECLREILPFSCGKLEQAWLSRESGRSLMNGDAGPVKAELTSPRDRHLFGGGHKRILALDGGGIRGAMTIAFLQRLERIVEEIEGRPVLLGDWFDLIGGTSTGAIIASGLALGYRASDLHQFYSEL